MDPGPFGIGIDLWQQYRTNGLAAQLTALLGPTASFWLPGPQYMFSDASATVPCGDTDLIWVWKDASANGRDLTQATSAGRPTARLVTGKWTARFDGVDDFVGASSPPISTGLFVGLRSAFTTAFDNTIVCQDNVATSRRWLVRNNTAGFTGYVSNGASFPGATAAYTGLRIPRTGSFWWSGTQVFSRLDATEAGPVAASITMSPTVIPIRVGSRGDGANFFNGDLSALFVVGSELTSETRATLRSILDEL